MHEGTRAPRRRLVVVGGRAHTHALGNAGSLDGRAGVDVSVVMSFLDAERFIEAAIESVLAQSYGSWELLLVDDGSTDQSSAIARRYASQHATRIRYMDHAGHANRGKSVSRNLGLARGSGRYIAFLDADDEFFPDKLEAQVTLLERETAAVMVYGNTLYWHSWEANAPDTQADRPGKLGVQPERRYLPPDLLRAYLGDPGIVPCLCALLVRKDAALAVGGFEEAIHDLYEDQVLIAKLVLAGPVYVESACRERYRQHPWSSSARALASGDYHPTRPHRARRIYLEWLEGYLTERGLMRGSLARRLRRALRPYRHPIIDSIADRVTSYLSARCRERK